MKWAFSFIFSSSSFRDDIPFYLVLIFLTNVIRPSEEELNEYRISQQIQPTDRISLLGLAQLAPGKPVECRLAHADGSVESIHLDHSMNEQQIQWFQAGSALNRMKEVAAAAAN